MKSTRKDPLRWYHKILVIVFIPICIIITGWYGWIGYATVTERPGLNGDWYYYYQLTRQQFSAYNFTVALIALVLGVLQLFCLFSQNKKLLSRTFWAFLIFISLIVLAEVYLDSRRIQKG